MKVHEYQALVILSGEMPVRTSIVPLILSAPQRWSKDAKNLAAWGIDHCPRVVPSRSLPLP